MIEILVDDMMMSRVVYTLCTIFGIDSSSKTILRIFTTRTIAKTCTFTTVVLNVSFDIYSESCLLDFSQFNFTYT